ncbi:MAG: hypothetical protein AAFZ52_06960 [Bacteroidota bacterium]
MLRTLLFLTLLSTCGCAQIMAQSAQQLINETVAAVGGMEALHALKDVSFDYVNYRGASQERYVFDGEISWGKSMTKDGKTRVQYYDGHDVTVWIDGEKTTDAQELKSALFTRKTNYYWLAMIQKMSDPGLVYEYAGKRTYEGIEYDLVDVTFEDGVGVAKDRYLLYINPYTKLVDQFLFTVAAVGRQDPILMKYTYDTFPGGVKLPVVAQSIAAKDWDGAPATDAKWSSRYRANFRFNQGFSAESILD